MSNSNIYSHLHIEQSMYPTLPSLPPMPNYAQSSEQIEQSLNKSTESTMSSCSNNSIPQNSSNAIKRMIIFDWDDTLFPTTEFWKKSKPISLENLYKWGSRVFKLLKLYIDVFGSDNIYIITNGDDGWIQQSLQMVTEQFQLLNNWRSPFEPFLCNYFMAIDALIKLNEIKTISARSLYKHRYPKQSKKWKECTFIDYAISHFNGDNEGIILSIGDSSDEWFASKDCTEFLTNLDNDSKFHLQRIKLKRKPTLNELMNEWEALIMFANDLKSKTASLNLSDLYAFYILYEEQMNKKRVNSNPNQCLSDEGNI